MDKLIAVIKREYLERVRTKWFIISTVFGPVFLLAISVLPGLLTARNIRDTQLGAIEILDASGIGLGDRLAAALRTRTPSPVTLAPGRRDSSLAAMTPPVNATVRVTTPSELAQAESVTTHAVIASTIRGYVVLDSASVTTGKARFAGRNTGLGEVSQIESALRSAIIMHRLALAGIVDARADSLTRVRVDVTAERLSEKGRGDSGLAGLIFGFLIAFLLYMMIILYGQNILRGVLEEKTTRVAEVVISSVSPETLLAGKVIGVGAVGLTQQLAWLTFGGLLSLYGLGAAATMGMNFTMPHVTTFQVVCLILFFLLGYTFYASLFAAVGAMCSSQEEATQAAQPVMMLLVASIILVQPIMATPTGTMANVMSMLPFSAPIIMPLVMASTDVPAWHIAVALGGLAVACVGAIWVSARIYRVGLLMTGKRPSLKELVRWVRYA
jgi:ABC-2 type transport system permease protein